MVANGVVVLCASIAASALVEALSWLLIYRTNQYQKLKGLLLRTGKKLESVRAAPGANKSKKKREHRHEEQIRVRMQQIQRVKFVGIAITSVILFVFYQMLTHIFDGVPVARLPFEPHPMIAMVTHRGLPGEQMREVSVSCIYLLCQYSTKVLAAKVFNFGISPDLEKQAASGEAWNKLMGTTD